MKFYINNTELKSVTDFELIPSKKELKRKLKQALKDEDYMLCAEIRDKLIKYYSK